SPRWLSPAASRTPVAWLNWARTGADRPAILRALPPTPGPPYAEGERAACGDERGSAGHQWQGVAPAAGVGKGGRAGGRGARGGGSRRRRRRGGIRAGDGLARPRGGRVDGGG